MKRTALKYTGKNINKVESALVPESTVKVTRMVPTAYRKQNQDTSLKRSGLSV